jgi:hypothetical protein
MVNLKFFQLIFPVILLLSSFAAASQTLDSLTQRSLERPNWKNDISEVGYVGCRCFANFTVAGGYFAEKGNTPDLISRGNMYLNIADSMLPAIYYFESKNGYTNKDTETRITRLAAINLQTMALNKDLHNNAFYGFVGEDFQFCNIEGPFYVEFSKMLAKN